MDCNNQADQGSGSCKSKAASSLYSPKSSLTSSSISIPGWTTVQKWAVLIKARSARTYSKRLPPRTFRNAFRARSDCIGFTKIRVQSAKNWSSISLPGAGQSTGALRTGSYKCLFQLSNGEFAKYWHGDIYDIRDCSIAAARKFATEAAQFEKDMGRRATAAELYCIHQQGYEGCAFHYDAPQQLAWKNMYLTTEGQEKGAKWARKAIWGNVPWDLKKTIKGGVEALTSGQFLALWTERVNRFIARKVEPPTHYVQRAKVKKPTKLAASDKKKTKSVASKKEKITKLETR